MFSFFCLKQRLNTCSHCDIRRDEEWFDFPQTPSSSSSRHIRRVRLNCVHWLRSCVAISVPRRAFCFRHGPSRDRPVTHSSQAQTSTFFLYIYKNIPFQGRIDSWGFGVGTRTMRCDECRISWAAQVLPEQRAPSSRDLHPAQDNEKWVQTPRLRLAAAQPRKRIQHVW